MNTKPSRLHHLALASAIALALLAPTGAWTPQAVEDDPLVRMPGTQPADGVVLDDSTTCVECHSSADPNTSIAGTWKGSLMTQAARDPLFWAALVVAGQDSIWAVGTPNAVDLCERCHFPEGWLEGRSDPPNVSAMAGSDFDGVHCTFCHRMWDPFFDSTFDGSRESSDWTAYWDEAGPLSAPAATATREVDAMLAGLMKLFSGDDFFVDDTPRYSTYTENGGGQYFVDPGPDPRASFADADTIGHAALYSRHHKSKYFCGTCHDVSNPVLANLGLSDLADQSNGEDLISEQYPASSYFHVERTFSEFMLSAYGRPGGAPTNSQFQSQGGGAITHASSCQDCHMPGLTGSAAPGARERPGESAEHPTSGLPQHDLTGGNTWISEILASLDPDGPIYDPRNAEILDQGPAILTLDLGAGESPKTNGDALAAGAERARAQLRRAATIEDVSYSPETGALSFKVRNNTGHKLISGFPEGRRMFVNTRAWAGEDLLHEVNPYDDAAGTLRGLPDSPASPPLGPNESRLEEIVYEMHPASELTDEQKTFHFVLATGRFKDNRIPPRGFDIARAAERLCEPVYDGVSSPGYFTADEYAGGYDEVSLDIPTGADRVVVTLAYQGTSREYVEFLRDEINGTANSLPSPTLSGEEKAYIVQSDPFFERLAAWGEAIWDLWYHNHGLDGEGRAVEGIVPFEMARATWTAGRAELTIAAVKVSKARRSAGQRAKVVFGFRLDSGRDIEQGVTIEVGSHSETLTPPELRDKKGRVWIYRRPKTAAKEGIKKAVITWDRKGDIERTAVKVTVIVEDAIIFPEGMPDDALVDLGISIAHGTDHGAATVALAQKKAGKLRYKARD